MLKTLLAKLGLGLFTVVATIFFVVVVAVLLIWHFAEVALYKLRHGWKAEFPKTKWL